MLVLKNLILMIYLILICIFINTQLFGNIIQNCPLIFKLDTDILVSKVDSKMLKRFIDKISNSAEDIEYINAITTQDILSILNKGIDSENQSLFLQWEEEIIGILNFSINYFPLIPEAIPTSNLGVIYLNFILVPKEYRHLGVASTLLWNEGGLISIAKKHKIFKIITKVPNTLKSAINFLKKNKFKPINSQDNLITFELDLNLIKE